VGVSRAQARGRRVDIFRKSLGAHWAVGDAVGGHEASIMATASAAKLLGLCELAAKAEELGIGVNWARHAAPPALAKMRQTPFGIKASLLEDFRGQLHAPFVAEEPAVDLLLTALGVHSDEGADGAEAYSTEAAEREQESIGLQPFDIVHVDNGGDRKADLMELGDTVPLVSTVEGEEMDSVALEIEDEDIVAPVVFGDELDECEFGMPALFDGEMVIDDELDAGAGAEAPEEAEAPKQEA
ncbi:unnamed protein product, partial [Prorocentrum cordatum]